MLEFTDITKSFDGQPVLRGVSYTLEAGEILVLLGPSGCGKTTLLRIIAGLESVDSGELFLDGEDLTETAVHERGFGFVFQDYALFPHKNVYENVVFGLRMQDWPEDLRHARVEQVLNLVGLVGFDARSIHDLSGGEQQRVALARSLAPAPRLLLLDEPLGALDRALRERLMLDLRAILKDAGSVVGRPEGITAVYVTHDQAEAFAIADQVLVLNQGLVEQVGTPTDLYSRPTTPFVARFLGMENIFEGKVQHRQVLNEAEKDAEAQGDDPAQSFVAETELGELLVAGPIPADAIVSLLIRPEAGRLAELGARENVIEGVVDDVSFRGRYQIMKMLVGDSVLKLEMETAGTIPNVGEPVTITLDKSAILPLEGA